MFDPSTVGDACGTGFVASVSGDASHEIVERAVEAVVNLTHRGAVNADPETGDGAGVAIQIPFDLLRERLSELGHAAVADSDLAVAVVFLPGQPDGEPEKARLILETALDSTGLTALGWRPVPVDATVLGPWALARRPEIEQLLIARPDRFDDSEYARRLYLARRRAERAFRTGNETVRSTYIASMSAESVVYKGLMLAPQLPAFYPDLPTPAPTPASRSSTSATLPTPCPTGGWPSPCEKSPTTARSTPWVRTSPGWRRGVWTC